MDIPSEFSHCSEQSRCVAKGFNALTSFSKANKNLWRTDKTMRKSIDWKLGVFGIIALILALGLVPGDAFAAATGRVTSGGRVIAGSTRNAIQIGITGATVDVANFSITAPEGWPLQSNIAGDPGYIEVTVGGSVINVVGQAVTIDPTAAELTISYTNVTVPAKVGTLVFAIRDPVGETNATSEFSVVVTADGSGDITISEGTTVNVHEIPASAGVSGKTFKFTYTAIGEETDTDLVNQGGLTQDNPSSLNGGELQLVIPQGWPTPVIGGNIVVSGDPSGVPAVGALDAVLVADPDPAALGAPTVSGSGPWTISVPIIAMGGSEQIEIQYKDVTVPFGITTYSFPVQVKQFGGILTQVQATDPDGLKVDSVKVVVAVAERGSGTMTVTGGPVEASSQGNTLIFVYTAAGTLDGGALELVPRDAEWTDPQGAQGSIGYTTVAFSPGVSATYTFGPNHVDHGGARAPDFSGDGVGILFSRMRVNDTVTIVYGVGGAGNGATAPKQTGLSYFDVYVGPDYSSADDIGIGSGKDGAGEGNTNGSKFLDSKAPFVSVQSKAGIGIVTITEMVADGDNLVADATTDRITTAGRKGALVFKFTAAGDMNGGAFSITLDNSWPAPNANSTSASSDGSASELIFRQQEIIVPIVTLSATQTITVTYGDDKDNRVIAPGIPEDSVFTFKTRSTSTGTFVAIADESDTDVDPRFFEVKVTQAADGSGSVAVDPARVTAGSTGNTFAITYTAVGQMDGGEIELMVPGPGRGNAGPWTDLRDHLSVQTTSGSVTGETFPDARRVRYTISSLAKGGTVKFTYTDVEVQSVLSSDGDNDGTADTTANARFMVSVKGSNEVKGSDESGSALEVADGGDVIVDSAADGSGTATVTITSAEHLNIENDDVPANITADIVIEYTAAGDMSAGQNVDTDANKDPNNVFLAKSDFVSFQMIIPSVFPVPREVGVDGVTDSDAGSISVEGTRGIPDLELFGRIVSIRNVALSKDDTLRISYNRVTTPSALGTYSFDIKTRGRGKVKEAPDRSLQPLTGTEEIPGSPEVTIGPVVSGSGSAVITLPVATGDDKVHTFIAGAEDVTIVIEFTAEGSMDSISTDNPSQVLLRVEDAWVPPGGAEGSNSSSEKGYTTVVPSSGVNIGTLDFQPNDYVVIIPITRMGKGDKLTITYGAGSAGVDVPESPRDYDFTIETVTRSGAEFGAEEPVSVARDEEAEAKLTIKATDLTGSGIGAVDMDNVPVSQSASDPRRVTLRFTYTAAGNIDAIELSRSSIWPTPFADPSSDTNNGRITVSRGELDDDDVSPGLIELEDLDLTEGDSVTITYSNAATPTSVGLTEFTFQSGTNASRAALASGKVNVYVVSKDGSGKVADDANDRSPVTTPVNEVFSNSWRAGAKASLVFYYNLDADEYIRDGELKIVVPRSWTGPSGVDLVQSDVNDDTPAEDKPSVAVSGKNVTVSIKKMPENEELTITLKEMVAPAHREMSRFRVSAKSTSGGRLSPIALNRPENSTRLTDVIVNVVDGASGSGTVTVTRNGGPLSEVPSGSNNNEIRFVYEATFELSSRDGDGDLEDDATRFSTNHAGIQLTIPAGWSQGMPLPDTSPEANGSTTASLTVSGPRSIFFDYDDDGDINDDIQPPSGGRTITVPIKRITRGQRITLTYGDGVDKAEAQGTKGEPSFTIKSKGGESSDNTFANLPKAGPVGDAGDIKFKVIAAGDGSGTIAATIAGGVNTTNEVYGGDSGIAITFTYTPKGRTDPGDTGAAIRIEPPTGWSFPQGSNGLAGYTTGTDGSTSRLGVPTFDGVGVNFPLSTAVDGNAVMIVYGSGQGASGAISPNQRSDPDELEKAPKFTVTMRGSSSGSFQPVIRSGIEAEYAFSGIPIKITNARPKTGFARILPAETNAGHKDTYTVTYTAAGPLFGGKVQLTIPAGWGLAAYNKDKSPFTTSGKLADGAPDDAADYDADSRTITARIKELQGGQTVTFTLKETTAQVTVEDNVEFRVHVARDDDDTFTDLTHRITGDNHIAKVKIIRAADGSGSMVALASDGASADEIRVVRIGENLPGGIFFRFTPAGVMEAEGQIQLKIPDGWTAPVREDDVGKAGGISILDDPQGTGSVGTTQLEDKDPSDRTAIAFIKAEQMLTPDDSFFIKYDNPTAPAVSGVYTFEASSKGFKDGALVALGEPPKIIVSPEGDGAGAMEIDKADAPAASTVTIKFTFTVADEMSGGELAVKIPDTWGHVKDKVGIKAGDGTTEKKVTFIVPGSDPDHTKDFSVRDGDRTIAIPIPSLAVRSQIVFIYTGTIQKVAGIAELTTMTRLENDGTLTKLGAGSPEFMVKNVVKGSGTVTFNTGDPVDPSRVAAASTGNQITFDFKAAGTMDGGAVSMDVPGNWSPPQRVSGVAGYVTASTPSGGSIGALVVDGNNVLVPIVTLSPDLIVRIVYGSGSGSSGAVAQDNAGGATFIFKSKGSSGDNFDDSTIGNQPTVNVTNARDGSGMMTVVRTDAVEGMETNVTAGGKAEFVFTYTPAGTINGGKVQLTVPPGWTPPNNASGTPGFTTAETDAGAVLGTLTFDANSVTVPISALSVGQTVRIKYGSGGGINRVQVPAETGTAIFSVKSQGLTDAQSGQLIELLTAPPVITITSPSDGFGTATVSGGPYRGGSAGNTAVIIFTANANVDGASVSVDVPMGWSMPTADNIAVVSTGTIGEVSYADGTVTVDGVTLSASRTITFTYSNATVQGAAGSATFIVKSKGSAEGTLTQLVNVSELMTEWTVSIENAADGSGMLSVYPSHAVAGSVVNVELTYTAVGRITGGVIRVTINPDWTTPQNVNVNDAGYVAVSASTGSVISTAIVSANVVVIPVTSITHDGTVTVTYKKATVPATAGMSEFVAQSRGRGDGASKNLAAPAIITITEEADSIMVVSEQSTVFADAVVAVALKLLKDGEAAGASEPVTVWLSADSTTGAFDTTMDGDFDGTVDSAVIPAGETWINVYYKDAVQGEVVITGKVAEFAEDMQMSTTTITISAGATALSLSTMGTLFSDGMVEIMLETQDDAGNPSASGTDVVVTLSSSSEMGSFMVNGNPLGEDMTVTVMAGETSPMGTLTYTDTTVGMATLMATAEDLTDAMPLEVMVNDVIGSVTVEPMMAMAGQDVTVTAIAKPGLMPVPSFTVGDIVQTGIDLTESPDGTYTGMFTVVAEVHADGMYDVVVTVGEGEGAVTKTVENGVTIDNTAPMITSGHDAPISAQNGDTVMLMVSSEEADLIVMGTGVQAVDTMAESDSIPFMESADTAGMYKAEFMISAENDADNGMYMISVTAMDAAGNASTAVSITVSLQNGGEFQLMVPDNISLIHIPLKVTSVDGENQMLEKISDLYDALGADNVNLLITYDVEAGKWASFLNAGDKGSPADREITADLGILASMNNEVTRILRGEAWGENGVSMINLSQGTNLVGVPLDSEELDMVSDLLSDDVSIVIASDQGEFKTVTQPGDPGDGPIAGGRSYIVTATQATTIEVTGEAWSSMPSAGVTAAPIAIPHIAAVDGITPVLAIRGSITGESRGIAQVDLRITVRNLSTGASVSVVSGGEGDAGQYDVTFVDTKAARAAQVGDVLEIKAESPNPLIGVQPLRHIVSVDDVKNSRIQLAELVTYEIPAKTELLLNYPNPFNPETWIPFRLAEDSQVSLTIYDRTGRVVRSVDVGHRPAAVYETRAKAIYWDGRNDFGERVASGMYFYTLTAKDFSATRRMVILK